MYLACGQRPENQSVMLKDMLGDENHANKALLRPETTHNKLTAKSFYSDASTKTDEHKS